MDLRQQGVSAMDIIPGQNGVLGAEIRGVDLRSASKDAACSILDAVHRHALVKLKHQKMTVHEYLEFGLKLGTMMPYPDSRYHHPEHPEVFVSSNVKSRSM